MPARGYSPRTPDGLAALSREEGGLEVIAQLTKEEQKSSASNWTRRHLIAYRLLVEPEVSLLDVFADDHEEECALCDDDGNGSQELNWKKTNNLTGRTPSGIGERSEPQLRQLSGGAFWVALSRAIRREALEERPHSQRKKLAAKHFNNMVNSTTAIDGSSSPSSTATGRESKKEYDPSDEPDELDEDEHDEWLTKGEGVTVHLMNCFLEETLIRCLQQDSEDEQVWPRVDRNMATAWINGHHISAEDDGGLRRMAPKGREWKTVNPFLALLEAKRGFKCIEYDKAGRAHPVVSDATLAQGLGEAVITWQANREDLDHDVPFLIAATNTYVRFLHFHFSEEYEEYLETEGTRAQKKFVRKRDAFARLQCTKWFNLAEGRGREQAFCNLLALLRWHDAQ